MLKSCSDTRLDWETIITRPKELELLEEYLKAVPGLTMLESRRPEVTQDMESIKKELEDMKAEEAKFRELSMNLFTALADRV